MLYHHCCCCAQVPDTCWCGRGARHRDAVQGQLQVVCSAQLPCAHRQHIPGQSVVGGLREAAGNAEGQPLGARQLNTDMYRSFRSYQQQALRTTLLLAPGPQVGAATADIQVIGWVAEAPQEATQLNSRIQCCRSLGAYMRGVRCFGPQIDLHVLHRKEWTLLLAPCSSLVVALLCNALAVTVVANTLASCIVT